MSVLTISVYSVTNMELNIQKFYYINEEKHREQMSFDENNNSIICLKIFQNAL